MKQFILALAVLLALPAAAAWAEDAAAPACTVSTGSPGATPFSSAPPPDQVDATITCTNVTEPLGRAFNDILNKILQDRLDPQAVLAKLEEVDRVPGEGVERTVTDDQRQAIVQNLSGKPAAAVTVVAHPQVNDSAPYALGIAQSLLMAGWQIDGNQIRRAAPRSLDPLTGVAIVVRDRNTPPEKATQLRAALGAAHIGAVFVSDASVAPDAAMLYVGRRPNFMSGEPPK